MACLYLYPYVFCSYSSTLFWSFVFWTFYSFELVAPEMRVCDIFTQSSSFNITEESIFPTQHYLNDLLRLLKTFFASFSRWHFSGLEKLHVCCFLVFNFKTLRDQKNKRAFLVELLGVLQFPVTSTKSWSDVVYKSNFWLVRVHNKIFMVPIKKLCACLAFDETSSWLFEI